MLYALKDRWLQAKWFVLGDWWETRLGQWLCERSAHAPGVRWYSGGMDPDMHCKRCNKDLQ